MPFNFRLSSLRLSGWKLDRLGPTTSAFDQLPLRSLTIEGGSISQSHWENLELRYLENLQLLSVSGVTAGFFSSFTERFPRLEALSLAQTRIDRMGTDVLPSLKKCARLVHLNLDGPSLEPLHVTALVRSVGRRLKTFILCPTSRPLAETDVEAFGNYCYELEALGIVVSEQVLPKTILNMRSRCKALTYCRVLSGRKFHEQSHAELTAAGILLDEDEADG